MQMTGIESVELASYQLTYMTHIWFMQWNENKGENDAPRTWDVFIELF